MKSGKSGSNGFIRAINLDKLVLKITSGSYQEFFPFQFYFFSLRNEKV